jgi:TonB family protein
MMTLFLTYELKVAVLIVVFYIFWRLLVANETWHRLNRIVLLSTALASFVLPFCVITIHQTVEVMPLVANTFPLSTDEMAMPMESAPAVTNAETEQPFNWLLPLTIIYIIGVVVVLLKMLLSLWRLHRMRGESEIHPLSDDYRMAVCEKVSTPFSWWNTVFMNHNDYEKGANALLTHELGHLQMHHSADVLLVELLTALQWFNPTMWMLRADLRTIHEYEADQQVLSHGFNDIQYLQLLIRKAAGQSGYSLANGISNSALKKRVTMIMKPKSNRNSMLKLLALIPIVGISLVLNANTVTDYVNDEPQKQQPIKKGKKAGTIKMGSQSLNDIVVVAEAPTTSKPANAADDKPFIAKGFVYDNDEDISTPIVGAVILVDGTKKGTVTDREGKFQIEVSMGDRITASYVGYESKTIGVSKVYSESSKTNEYYIGLKKETGEDNSEKIYDVVEEMPEFPGGPATLYETLVKSIQYPEEARIKGAQGRAIVTFVVEKDGSISNARVVKSVDPSLDAEALRVINSMPKWNPGKQNGEPVRVKYTAPVRFSLDAARPAARPAEGYVLEIDGKVADDAEIANIPPGDVVSMDVVPAQNGQPKKIVITTKKKQ